MNTPYSVRLRWYDKPSLNLGPCQRPMHVHSAHARHMHMSESWTDSTDLRLKDRHSAHLTDNAYGTSKADRLNVSHIR